jgi:hypothetical protein
VRKDGARIAPETVGDLFVGQLLLPRKPDDPLSKWMGEGLRFKGRRRTALTRVYLRLSLGVSLHPSRIAGFSF